MQKSKLVSSLFETALTIVKYIATFSFLFSFLLPISIVTALFFFFQPCCYNLSNLQEWFRKYECK